jgi:hypothetical protein
MLKDQFLMKKTEAHAGKALRELLEKIPILQVKGIVTEAASGDWEPNLLARPTSGSKTCSGRSTLCCAPRG